MIENLGGSGSLALRNAERIDSSLGHTHIGVEHLFLGIVELEDRGMQRLTAAGTSRHQTLADYFGRLADPEPPDDEGFHSWSGEYRRAFAELPYHQIMAREWDRVFATLTDFTFLERKSVKVAADEREEAEGKSKTVYNGPYQLQDDYRLALAVDAFPAE